MSVPLLIAVITAVSGLLGTGLGAIIQGFHASSLERQKFESSLILKALEPSEPQDRANYLRFLVDIGLVKSLDGDKIIGVTKKPELIPRSVPAVDEVSSRKTMAARGAVLGSIKITREEQWEAVGKGGKILGAFRKYESGRVYAFGHDDMLNMDAYEDNLSGAFRWLSEGAGGRSVTITTGHCEWVPTRKPNEAPVFAGTLKKWGYSVRTENGAISDAMLQTTNILVIGNAWGSITDKELSSIHRFVADGGSLLVAGLGWSWVKHSIEPGFECPGQMQGQDITELASYPMNRVVKPYGLMWVGKKVN